MYLTNWKDLFASLHWMAKYVTFRMIIYYLLWQFAVIFWRAGNKWRAAVAEITCAVRRRIAKIVCDGLP
ncbi:hypothetical protein ACG04R_26615 [Roseateles sp. BYS78W]|uniref:Uncharacterized protein n=1 Tax=Pelomonas candidula TaxID=3299025 RepID=A0ABW7HK23_9BURK